VKATIITLPQHRYLGGSIGYLPQTYKQSFCITAKQKLAPLPPHEGARQSIKRAAYAQ